MKDSCWPKKWRMDGKEHGNEMDRLGPFKGVIGIITYFGTKKGDEDIERTMAVKSKLGMC